MEPEFFNRSLRLFDLAEFSTPDLAELLNVHEQTVRRWRNRQIGFKDKSHVEQWAVVARATLKALQNRDLPFRAIRSGPERHTRIKSILSQYL